MVCTSKLAGAIYLLSVFKVLAAKVYVLIFTQHLKISVADFVFSYPFKSFKIGDTILSFWILRSIPGQYVPPGRYLYLLFFLCSWLLMQVPLSDSILPRSVPQDREILLCGCSRLDWLRKCLFYLHLEYRCCF